MKLGGSPCLPFSASVMFADGLVLIYGSLFPSMLNVAICLLESFVLHLAPLCTFLIVADGYVFEDFAGFSIDVEHKNHYSAGLKTAAKFKANREAVCISQTIQVWSRVLQFGFLEIQERTCSTKTQKESPIELR